VDANRDRLLGVLDDGERLCGEWLWQAHGTRYALPHEPFVAFDIMTGHKRLPVNEFRMRIGYLFELARVLHDGGPCPVDAALDALGEHGHHGAIDRAEGAVWRVERNKLISKGSSERRWVVDFLAKYVRPGKVDGRYLPELNGGETVLNTFAGADYT